MRAVSALSAVNVGDGAQKVSPLKAALYKFKDVHTRNIK